MDHVHGRGSVLFLLIISCGAIALAGFHYDSNSALNLLTFFWPKNGLSAMDITRVSAGWFVMLAALAIGCLLNVVRARLLGALFMLTALPPLLSLLGTMHWLDELGGFPAIGSGQGIIKYFSLVAIALALIRPAALSHRHLMWINYFPVALVLLWIGGMKFTAYEAQGIEGLVATSPFMSWLYDLFDLQTASNLIGVYDLVALTLLGIGLWLGRNSLLYAGLLMSLAVFAMTQTFLVSFEGALHPDGLLTGAGVFIIKDLWFIANLILLVALRQGQGDERLSPEAA